MRIEKIVGNPANSVLPSDKIAEDDSKGGETSQPNQVKPKNAEPKQKSPLVKKQALVGRLSEDEQDFIRENVDILPPEKIAEHLNRRLGSVLDFIHRKRLGKEYGHANSKSTTRIMRELKHRPFFRHLHHQLTLQEIALFREEWTSMMSQFQDDIMPSEEMELKELIIIEILKNRENAAEKKRLMMHRNLHKQLEAERRLPVPDKDAIRALNEQLLLCSSNDKHVKNFKDLCDRSEKIRKALHASRQDRVKSYDNIKVDFVGWLKMLEDHNQKVKVSREMEIMKMAQARERARLYGLHKYANNEVAVPILNEDSVKTNTTDGPN